jgi:hypothetical protein
VTERNDHKEIQAPDGDDKEEEPERAVQQHAKFSKEQNAASRRRAMPSEGVMSFSSSFVSAAYRSE